MFAIFIWQSWNETIIFAIIHCFDWLCSLRWYRRRCRASSSNDKKREKKWRRLPQNNQQPDLVRLIDLRTSQSQLEYSKISEIWRHSAQHVTPDNEIRFAVIRTETEFLQSGAQNIHTSEGQKKEFILDNMAYIHSGLRPQYLIDYNSNGYSVNTCQMAFLRQQKKYWNGLCLLNCATLEPLHNFDNILKKSGQLI